MTKGHTMTTQHASTKFTADMTAVRTTMRADLVVPYPCPSSE